ncbi:MAG TPA: hypothetical protein VFH35_09645 [Ramlibacter sp.]|nr:hypothetical protein [Ramlibacter sp.]
MTSVSAETAATHSHSQAAAESARYTLLRRLAPSMRHHLVVNLQPIGMIYEVMDRRLRAPQPDLSTVHESAHKINGFARAALASCLDVVSWLAPEEGAASTVHEGVRECMGLLATSFSFRGYALRNETGTVEGKVRRAAMRNVLTAALIHITDESPPPADLVLTAQPLARGVELTLSLAPSTGDKGFASEPGYRPLAWADVQALAASEGAGLEREDAATLRIMIPWAKD